MDPHDPAFAPRPRADLDAVAVDDEVVLLDGWSAAMVLNATGTEIWRRLDGTSTVADAIRDLTGATGADVATVRTAVVDFVETIAAAGLLANAEPALDPAIRLVPDRQPQVGDLLDDLSCVGVDGRQRSLSEYLGREVLLVNWNPFCGYCASIAHTLATYEAPLEQTEVGVVYLASGDADSNRDLAQSTGIDAPVLLLDEADSPFGAAGTPSAFHLDPDGRITEAAYGNVEVPALARRLAGTSGDSEQAVGIPSGDVERTRCTGPRYLLETGGLCAPGTGTRYELHWSEPEVFDVGGFHVGFRVDSPATSDALGALFASPPIEDPRAGHSYSIALPGLDSARSGSGRGLNLLVQPGHPTVRTRDPARALRALLSDLHDKIHGPTGVDGTALIDGRVRVRALPIGVRDGVGLVPLECHYFAPVIQSMLATRGLALGDVPHPEVDLGTGEVVIPEPAVDHDPAVLDSLTVDLAGTAGERPALLPGRYPLEGWCVFHPGERTIVRFTPAEAAAATLSLCHGTDDPPERVRQLARLFGTVPAYGIWYYSETELADLIARALGAW